MSRSRIFLIAVPLLAIAVVAVANYTFLQRHVTAVLDSDPRNNGIEVVAHYELYILPSVLVFDLRVVSPTNSPADVFRILLQFAQAQKERSFSLVKLAHRGTEKFYLKGDYFQRLGQEYGEQNPVYTMRTFPENVYRTDGTPAFGTWTGGLLGVLTKQMGDFGDFHKQWYIADLAKSGG